MSSSSSSAQPAPAVTHFLADGHPDAMRLAELLSANAGDLKSHWLYVIALLAECLTSVGGSGLAEKHSPFGLSDEERKE